jgi:hypothetical protein
LEPGDEHEHEHAEHAIELGRRVAEPQAELRRKLNASRRRDPFATRTPG